MNQKNNTILAEQNKMLVERVNELSSLIEVSIIINSTLDLDKLLELVLVKAQSVMHAEASSVLLINKDTNKLECKVALGKVGAQVAPTIQLSRGQGVAGWVWEHEEPLIVADAATDKRFFSGVDRQSGFKTDSILAVPLIVQDRIIGVAEVINRVDGNQFTANELELFSTFGRQVALAIENAQMHQIALEQERINQQLESAKVIQQSFMPQFLPSSPGDIFQLAAKNISANAVGGDFYDAIRLNERYLGLLMGDVSGKGVPAALQMARIMSDFRFYAHKERQPGQLLHLLNNELVERCQQGMFVTVQYAIVDLKNGTLSLANGGHLPAVHWQPRSQKAQFITVEEGIPLGISKDVSYQSVDIALQPKEYIMFYTDGLVEIRNKNREEYSLTRLLKSVSGDWNNASSFLNGILEKVRLFSENKPSHDDLTAMVFRWNG